MISRTLSSGLKCCVFPRKEYKEKMAMIAVRFGSDVSGFAFADRSFVLPSGTAHFIEHKMFDMPEGNIMAAFSDMGANVNAFTSFNETAYYFSCTENFYDTLKLLIRMVSVPYFRPENIDPEREIIAREINMYEDDPQWKCYFALLGGLYGDMPVSRPIAGTEKEIADIDADIMDICYNAFYTPGNIMLIAAGDVDADKIAETAEENFMLPEDKNIVFSDTDTAYTPPPRIENRADVRTPLFGVGFAGEDRAVNAENIVKTRLVYDCIFGESSGLYQRLTDGKLCDLPPVMEYLNGRCYNALLCTGASRDPDRVAEYMLEEVERARKNGLENIDKIVKKQWGELLMQQDSIESICNAAAACFAKNIDFLDICDIYGKMVKEKNICFDLPDMGAPVLSVVSGKG